MDKNTLTTYTLIAISVIIISILLVFTTPFGSYVTEGISNIADFYASQTSINGGENNRDTVNRGEGNTLERVVTLNFVYENGQKVSPTVKKTCAYGEKVEISSLMPSPEGYKPNYTPAEQTVTKDLDYTITYYPIQHAITYRLNGGTIVSSRPNTYIYGQTTKLPTQVIKSGCTFGGWYEDRYCQDESKKITEIDATRNTDIVVYAKWLTSGYNIKYMSHGAEMTPAEGWPTVATYGTLYELPILSTDTSNNAYFAGWYNNPEFNGSSVTHTPLYPDDDLIYYAKWDVAKGYNISYELNGGKFASNNYPQSYMGGSTQSLPQNLIKNGYRFAGWYGNPQCSGSPINAIKSNETGDKMFYANWIAEQYTISYDTLGGSIEGIPKHFYTVDNATTFPTSVNKPGYTFNGWINDKTHKEISSTAGLYGNLSLTAKYTKNSYTVTLNANGGIFSTNKSTYTKTVVYGSQYGFMPIPTKTGYNFANWEDDEGNIINSGTIFNSTTNVELNAVWKAKTYNINYVLNDGNWKANTNPPTTFTYNKNCVLPTGNAVYKAYYTFDYWCTDSGLTTKITNIEPGTNNEITVYAKWKPAEYTITCNANGGTFDNDNGGTLNDDKTVNKIIYTYNSNLTLPVPKMSGYIFNGWKDNTTKEILFALSPGDSGNKDLTAQWTTPSANIKVTLVDTDGEAIKIDGKEQTYTIKGVELGSSYTIPEDDIVRRLSIGDIYYHDKATINKVDKMDYQYELTVNPYKKINLSLKVENTNAFFKDYNYFYRFKSSINDSDITDFPENTDQFRFVTCKISIDDKEEEVSSKGDLVTKLKTLKTTAPIQVTLIYNEIEHTITYNDNGNSGMNYDENFPKTYYTSQGCVIPIPTHQHSCYYFTGWNDGKQTIYNEISIGTKGNITLTAQWGTLPPEDKNHNYTNTIKEASCTETGIEQCSICGTEREIPMKDHSFTGDYEQIDSEFADNYSPDVLHKRKCSNCNEYIYEEHNLTIKGASAESPKEYHIKECACGYRTLEEHDFEYSNIGNSGHTATCTSCQYSKKNESHMYVLSDVFYLSPNKFLDFSTRKDFATVQFKIKDLTQKTTINFDLKTLSYATNVASNSNIKKLAQLDTGNQTRTTSVGNITINTSDLINTIATIKGNTLTLQFKLDTNNKFICVAYWEIKYDDVVLEFTSGNASENVQNAIGTEGSASIVKADTTPTITGSFSLNLQEVNTTTNISHSHSCVCGKVENHKWDSVTEEEFIITQPTGYYEVPNSFPDFSAEKDFAFVKFNTEKLSKDTTIKFNLQSLSYAVLDAEPNKMKIAKLLPENNTSSTITVGTKKITVNIPTFSEDSNTSISFVNTIESDNTLKLTFKLQTNKSICGADWTVEYDNTALELVESDITTDIKDIMNGEMSGENFGETSGENSGETSKEVSTIVGWFSLNVDEITIKTPTKVDRAHCNTCNADHIIWKNSATTQNQTNTNSTSQGALIEIS